VSASARGSGGATGEGAAETGGLRDAVGAAGRALEEPFLEALADPEAVTFELLDIKRKHP
jgi:hypothetical protein